MRNLLLLVPNLVVLVLALLVLLCFEPLPHVRAQSNAKALDAILQNYAYKALVKPKTGRIYNATTQIPSNLTGIEVEALRLRSGSLRRKGFSMYNEFVLPIGIIETPYVERLVLVYQNLGNWSNRYYPLQNYTYLAPILGLLAYDASNLSATNLPELDLSAFGDPILVKFNNVKKVPDGAIAQCVWFDLKGGSNFSHVREGNTCSTSQQGHFSIVANYTSSEAPVPSPTTPREGKKRKSHKKVWIIVGSVLGGLVLLVLLLFLVLWIKKYKQKKKMQQMESAADVGEALHMASIGDTRAPSASVTRTQPTLEHEYAP